MPKGGTWNARGPGMGANEAERRRLAAKGGRQRETSQERRDRLKRIREAGPRRPPDPPGFFPSSPSNPRALEGEG
jgi:hypothetical protein